VCRDELGPGHALDPVPYRIAILDPQMVVIAWTWFISRPERQIATWQPHGRSHVPVGVSDGFSPPWANQVYDTRLLVYGGRHLLAT
jgi:hypothetical protein